MAQDHIAVARTQLEGIIAALDGDSRNVQQFHVESDDNPVRLLAAGLAHTINTLGAAVEELSVLRAEVDDLKSKRSLFR